MNNKMKKITAAIIIFSIFVIFFVYAENAFHVNATGNVGIGTENPQVKLDVAGEVRSTVDGTEFYMVPKGGIIMWSGPIAEIPTGWALCDGTQGTPDLQGRFVVGYNSEDMDYDIIGNIGGEKAHQLTKEEIPIHEHSIDHDHPPFTISGGAHGHTIETGNYGTSGESIVENADGRSSDNHVSGGSHSHTVNVPNLSGYSGSVGSDQPHENRPPYYVLAYIMKL